MLKLPNPMTRNLRIAHRKVLRVLYRAVLPVLLLLMCGQVNAQTVKAVINPTGGTSSADGIKVEVYSDGGIKVTRNGLTESYSHADSTTGLRAFFDFKSTSHLLDAANLKTPSICYISPVSGTGTSADPYKVHIIGTIQDKYYGGAGQTGTVTCIVSYIQNSNYFFMDFIMHMPNTSFGTSALFYLSEQSLMGAASSADPDEVSKCGYGFVSADGKSVGILRDVACAGAAEAPRSHVYRTYNQFDSYEASIPDNRFYVNDNGYFPNNIVATGVDGRGRSLAVMRSLGAIFSDAYSPDPPNIKTFRILSGYGTTATEFDGLTTVKDSFPMSGFSATPIKVQFSSAALSGNEGNTVDGEQVAQGLTLNVSGGKLGAPTYVLVQYDPSASFAHPAAVNTDFKLVQEAVLVPAGDYTTAKNVPISNLHVIGNDQLQYSRSLHLKLVATCASLININGTSECDYTIVDDEPRTMVLSMDSTQILEGNTTKARVKLSSGVTCPEDINVTFSRLATSTAGDTDFIVPASILIPANASGSSDFIIQAKSDKALENTEKLTLKFQGTILGITVTGQSDLLIQDSTYYNPAYAQIQGDFSPAATRPLPEGYTGNLMLHLPAGVTTEVPISIQSITEDNASTAEDGLDYSLDLFSGKTYSIPAGSTSVLVAFSTTADKLIEGPIPEFIRLGVVSLDNVGTKRSYPYTGADIPITDMDYDVNMKVTIAATTIKEGDAAGATITVALPNGIATSYPIAVALSRGLGSKAQTSDLTNAAYFPTSVTIGTNKKVASVAAKLLAKFDNILENDEILYIVTKPTGFATDSSIITIVDSTGLIPGNKNMNLQLMTSTLSEGASSDIKISLANAGIIAEDPIVVMLTPDAASVASSTDFNPAASVTLPALTNSYTATNALTAVTDNILEADEAFTLLATSTSIPGLIIPSFGGLIQDVTGTNPANKVITITPSVTAMDEGGTGYGFTFSLPAGITTEVPIVITPALMAVSTASSADYTLDSTTLTLDKTHNHSTYSGVAITDDNTNEGDETLILGGSAASTAITGLQLNQAPTVTIKDKAVAVGNLIITSDITTITEGAAGANITIKLPGGATTSVPISITASRGLSSQATSGYTGLPQTVALVGNSILLSPVSASADNIVGDDETLVVYIDAAGYPKDSVILQIKDATAVANRKITFTPQPTTQGSHVLEGNTYTVRASFPAGILPYKAVSLSVGASVNSVAGATDYTGVPTVVTIDPTKGYQDFTLTASTDNVLENTELLRIIGTVTNMSGVTVDSLDVLIDDATSLDPTKTKLKITFDSTAIHKGSFTKVTVGYADPSVTSTQSLSVSVTPDPASTADITNYSGLPTTVTLPKDSNFVTFFLNVPDNFKIEGTTILQFIESAAGYTSTVPPLYILDKNGAAIRLIKLSDAGEPSTNGAFAIKLPTLSVSNVTVTLSATYGSTNIQPIPTSVLIPAGVDSVVVPVYIQDDNIIQGDQVLSVILTKALAGTTFLIVDATPAVINVTDDESLSTGPKATARQILIEKMADATQPNIEGGFRVRFNDTTVVAAKDVSVNYNIGGTATAGTDYVGISGNVIIPKGAYGALIKIVPSGITSAGANQTVQLQLKNASSSIPAVVWSFVAIPQATVTIYNNNIDTPQVNVFAATSAITEGDDVQFIIRTTKTTKTDMPITIVVTNDIYRTFSMTGGVVKGDTIIVTMLAGQKERTINIHVDDNDVSDDDGFLQVSAKAYIPGSGTPAYTLGLASDLKNTVTDNDSLRISFTSSRYTAKVAFDTIGQPLPFTLRLNRTSSRIVTVYYEFFTPAAGELPARTSAAVGGKDYDNTVTPLLILPAQPNAEIQVLVNGVEKDKMFGMRLLRATVATNQHNPAIDSIVSASGIIEICTDCDVDGDGVPDYIERFVTDGRWKDDNNGNIRVHPALSPNNDGLGNDAMYIENIDKYPDNDVTVFNRWGGTVFTTKGYNNFTNNFNGKANTGSGKSQDVLDGSYFFIIHYTDAGGKKIRYTGYLVIKRS